MDNNSNINSISKRVNSIKTHINKKVKMKMKNKTLNKIESKKIMLPLLNNR
jgi:hypothetical protein